MAPSSSSNENEQHQKNESDKDSSSLFGITRHQCRAHFAGASVAENGFYMILRVAIPDASETDFNNNDKEPPDDDDDATTASSSTTQTRNYFLPIHVSDDTADRTAATSPEALTLLQLMANVDMAGSVLPPNVLERIVILTLEGDDDDDDAPKRTRTLEEESLVQTVQDQIFNLQKQQQQQKGGTSSSSINDDDMCTRYADCPSWLQSRVRLPVCTLNELVVDISVVANATSSSDAAAVAAARLEFGLNVSANDFGTFFLETSLSSDPADAASRRRHSSIVPCVSYTYRPHTSRAFLAMALALRYQAPVIVSIPTTTITNSSSLPTPLLLTKEELQQQFPLFRSLSMLQERSNNVVTSIKRGFAVNQLQAAYQIAIQRQDEAAMVKIRAKLDEIDDMSELPTQADSDTASMQ
jgi:hypothetical protein